MKITQKKVENIENKLSEKYKLPKEVIEDIWKSEFKFTIDKIREEKFKIIQLPGFAKFYVSIKKIKRIQKRWENCKYKNVNTDELKNNRETNKDLTK